MAKVTVKINKTVVKTVKVEYSGSAEQASRTLAFSVPYSPYQHSINTSVKLGDKVYAYYNKRRFFTGIVTTIEKTGEAGEMSITALDYCHFLIRDTGTYKFHNVTAEHIVKALCKDAGIKVGSIVKTHKKLKSEIFEEQSLYDIIMRAYFDAGQNVIIRFNGNKLNIHNRGSSSGITLSQNTDITSTSYTQSSEEMVNIVKVYNDKNQLVKTIKKDSWIRKYGRYISTYKLEEKGYTEAYNLLSGVKKECEIEAIGNIGAIAGKSIVVKNKNVSISGKFFISEDSHSFENNIHTMNLTLVWKNTIEQGADKEDEEENVNIAAWSTDAQGWYLESSTVIHSTPNCKSARNKRDLKRGRVGDIMTTHIISRGKNKGKTKYHACTRCWK